jgi:hypothetical protein
MTAAIDISGMRFNRLVALRRADKVRRGYWRFACDCGGSIACEPAPVKRGAIVSCGCYRAANTRLRWKKYREAKAALAAASLTPRRGPGRPRGVIKLQSR